MSELDDFTAQLNSGEEEKASPPTAGAPPGMTAAQAEALKKMTPEQLAALKQAQEM